MIQILKNIFKRKGKDLYVVMDQSDSSITLSPNLFKEMGGAKGLQGKDIFVFEVEEGYGFAIEPEQLKGKETQFCRVQYNSKHRTYGFETLCPTVAKIFYRAGIEEDVKRFSVEKKTADKTEYYKINMTQYGKSVRTIEKP